MLTTIFGAVCFLVGNPLTIGVPELRYGFGFDSCIANRANLMLASVYGAVCFLVCNPLTVGMTERGRNRFATI